MLDLEQAGATGYRAANAAEAVLVLAHGAGAGRRHPFMDAVGRGLAARGVDVVTFDFPYMRAGRKIPDRAPVLEAAFREAVALARVFSPGVRLFIGGKSMGGRMATHLGAAGDDMAGIVVFGYPLHPPGKPDRLRVEHLPSVRAPLLVVQGERDAFGPPSELEPVLDTMPGPTRVHAVAGGDHSLAVRGQSRDAVLGPVLDLVAEWIRAAR